MPRIQPRKRLIDVSPICANLVTYISSGYSFPVRRELRSMPQSSLVMVGHRPPHSRKTLRVRVQTQRAPGPELLWPTAHIRLLDRAPNERAQVAHLAATAMPLQTSHRAEASTRNRVAYRINRIESYASSLELAVPRHKDPSSSQNPIQ